MDITDITSSMLHGPLHQVSAGSSLDRSTSRDIRNWPPRRAQDKEWPCCSLGRQKIVSTLYIYIMVYINIRYTILFITLNIYIIHPINIYPVILWQHRFCHRWHQLIWPRKRNQREFEGINNQKNMRTQQTRAREFVTQACPQKTTKTPSP